MAILDVGGEREDSERNRRGGRQTKEDRGGLFEDQYARHKLNDEKCIKLLTKHTEILKTKKEAKTKMIADL
jgi:hypothetical protein